MDLVRTIILLLHPALATALLIWIWRQYSWRKQSFELKGDERAMALSKHEKNGDRLIWASAGVILIAFASRAIVALRDLSLIHI